MRYRTINQIGLYDLRDREWELADWSEELLAVRVSEPGILTGEHAGKRIAQALVTFRGIRPEEALSHDGVRAYTLTYAQAMDRFSGGPIFVFSYEPEDHRCEFCGLTDGEPLALCFDYDTVMVEWEEFEEDPPKRVVGVLRKL